MTEVYIVHNCFEKTPPITTSTFEFAEHIAKSIVENTDGITRKDMVWSFSDGIVAVYIQRVYLGRFHTDVLLLDKKMDILLERIALSNEMLGFVKKLDELLNMKIIVAKE